MIRKERPNAWASELRSFTDQIHLSHSTECTVTKLKWLVGWPHQPQILHTHIAIILWKEMNGNLLFIEKKNSTYKNIRAWFAFHMALEWSPQGLSFIRNNIYRCRSADDNQREKKKRREKKTRKKEKYHCWCWQLRQCPAQIKSIKFFFSFFYYLIEIVQQPIHTHRIFADNLLN